METMENINFPIRHKGENWEKFVAIQKQRIIDRLNKYNDSGIVEEQLVSCGDLTLYQRYKTEVVSKFLREALQVIDTRQYGYCSTCHEPILVPRLILVPGALRCVKCENKK